MQRGAEAALLLRQREALANLSAMVLENPEVMYPKEKGSAAAAAVPKLRRVISKARELPLTVELPASMNAADGLDMSLALNETKNVAVAIKEVWQRLNGADIRIEEELGEELMEEEEVVDEEDG